MIRVARRLTPHGKSASGSPQPPYGHVIGLDEVPIHPFLGIVARLRVAFEEDL